MRLLPYQKPIYRRMVELLQSNGRAAVVMPTGTGKFYLAAKYAEDNQSSKVLLIVPHAEIADHQLAKFEEGYGYRPENIEPITYMALVALMRKDRVGDIEADCIVLDEFHHVGAGVWGAAVNELCSRLPNAKVIGLSATPYRASDGGRDMGNEFFENNYAVKMYLSDAWSDPSIPLDPPKYISCVYSWVHDFERVTSKIARIKDDDKRSRIEKEMEELRRNIEAADGVDRVLAKHLPKRDGHYIFFCAGVDHLKKMEAMARTWFRKLNQETHFYRIYNELRVTEGVLDRFKADRSDAVKVLFCIDMLNEGIHCDNDGIIMARPTDSATVYMQQLGRALDVGSNKTSVVIDLVDNLSSKGLTETGFGHMNFWSQSVTMIPNHPEKDPPLFDITDVDAAAKEVLEGIERKIAEFSRLDDSIKTQWHPTKNG
ncbi:MAG: DEAD/DEAH box helicase family protein, partial [Raoultibacter sp.]